MDKTSKAFNKAKAKAKAMGDDWDDHPGNPKSKREKDDPDDHLYDDDKKKDHHKDGLGPVKSIDDLKKRFKICVELEI